MDPASVKPFDTFMHVRGGQGNAISSTTLVVGNMRSSPDLKEFAFTPALPYAHDGSGILYHVRVPAQRGVTDLAGNELLAELPPIEFTIDPAAPLEGNDGIVLRFDGPDEIESFGSFDLRGQILYAPDRGVIRPRPVANLTGVVSRSTPVPSIMTPFGPGVQTPLSPLGSKLQECWRYVDMGWTVHDETKYNVDVVGINWTPVGGNVSRDFFPGFEMRLAHSRKLPDEDGGRFALPRYPVSGLGPRPVPFADNILVDPESPQKVVHPRGLGYRVDPVDLFVGVAGTPLMPFPMNKSGGPLVTYTWRDTAILAKGGDWGGGVPLGIEVGPPLNLEAEEGTFAPVGRVPSVGLPLLWEIRCYPSSGALGLNPLDISLASNTAPTPNFRAYSTGGINHFGQIVTRDPDLQLVPLGGFNPGSRPPGRHTRQAADNALYLGQLDMLIRLSRAHSIWLDTKSDAPRYAPIVVEPTAADLPPRTQLLFHFRGADGFLDADQRPFAAETLDPYGDIRDGTILFHDDDPTWKSSISAVDGARYFQFRVTFVGDIPSRLVPELSAIGVAFESQ
jgi:hypothetical protein